MIVGENCKFCKVEAPSEKQIERSNVNHSQSVISNLKCLTKWKGDCPSSVMVEQSKG